VAIISAGRIVASGQPEDLGGDRDQRTEISFRLPAGVAAAELPDSVRTLARIDAAAVSLSADDPVPVLRELTVWASERQVGLPDLQVRRPTLEDVYLELTEQTDGAGEGPA
jgi:ABC-2 type transport system ATP-binding protein